MIAQYTQAALVSELKRLAVPASVDSIPSSAMQEDHVSMGWSAARKLRRSVDALTRVLAIELLTAARALDLRAPLQPGPGDRRGGGRRCARTSPGPGPTASSPRRSRPRSSSSRSGGRRRAAPPTRRAAPTPSCTGGSAASVRRRKSDLLGDGLLEHLADVDVEVPARERQHLGRGAERLGHRVDGDLTGAMLSCSATTRSTGQPTRLATAAPAGCGRCAGCRGRTSRCGTSGP